MTGDRQIEIEEEGQGAENDPRIGVEIGEKDLEAEAEAEKGEAMEDIVETRVVMRG